MGPAEITRLLLDWEAGRKDAVEELAPLVVDELRRIAAVQMSSEPQPHTLQPTALTNELFLHLLGRKSVSWRTRAQFFGYAARAMRRILVDHARAKKAAKRAGGEGTASPGALVPGESLSRVDLLVLDDALRRLARMDERQARVVELRCFCGLTIEETAQVLETSPSTISRLWTSARAWLYGELKEPPEA